MRSWLLGVLSGALTVVVVFPGGVAAQSTPEATPTGEGSLPVIVWQLSEAELADGTDFLPEDPSLYTVQFLPEGRLAARADCNQVAGAYAITGDALTISGLMTTLVGCPPGSMGTEYTSWLESVAGYEFATDSLVLGLADGGTLRFLPAIEGVVWEWRHFLGSNDTVVESGAPENYALQFEADGRVLVRADCNHGRGQYTVDAPALDIERIGLTRMACPSESFSDQFVAYLDEVTSFVIVDGELSLALPVDGGFLIFTARAIVDAPEDAPATPVAATPSGG
ncbi:MAG: META domain-containing protein [Chloroflexota bacterium]|nr:META domain-containing protein [Chloroflexota bacterium]